jgi:Flp pilus assembly protein TadB
MNLRACELLVSVFVCVCVCVVCELSVLVCYDLKVCFFALCLLLQGSSCSARRSTVPEQHSRGSTARSTPSAASNCPSTEGNADLVNSPPGSFRHSTGQQHNPSNSERGLATVKSQQQLNQQQQSSQPLPGRAQPVSVNKCVCVCACLFCAYVHVCVCVHGCSTVVIIRKGVGRAR